MLGWLYTIPEKAQEPRSVTEKGLWPLPDCEKFTYLAEFFIDLRLDFGFPELKAWCDLTGTVLEHWEVAALIDSSAVYRGSVMKFKDPKYNTRPPYDGRTSAQKSDLISNRLAAFFGE